MLSETDARQLVFSGRFRFDPLEVTPVEPEAALSAPGRADWILDMTWNGRVERFAVEYSSLSTPKRLEAALGQLVRSDEPQLRPMLMAPHLDENWLDRLANQGISGLDLSGNGVVVVPGRWLVYRTGEPNAYPTSQYIKAIYRGRSSFVPRVLMVRPRFDQVTGVRDEIRRRGGQISLSTVSKVLKRLEEELLLSREEGVELLQPAQLLDRLAASFEPPEMSRRISGRVEDPERAMETILSTAEEGAVNVAGRGERVYTLYPGSERTLSVYTTNLERSLEKIEFQETRRFPDLELLETREETVYFDRREREGFIWTSPVQTYLELAVGGKREREIAGPLRSELLTTAGG